MIGLIDIDWTFVFPGIKREFYSFTVVRFPERLTVLEALFFRCFLAGNI
jgi:hypothetical protein